jgi:hypothetical protein
LVAVLSLTTIIRLTASRSVRRVPSANSPSTPDPLTFFSFVSTTSWSHQSVPAATWANTVTMIGSLIVLAVRTRSSPRRLQVAPVSRFLA